MIQKNINRRGMAAMTAGTAAFALNDALMKHLVAHLPVSEIVVLRGAVSAALAFLLLMQAGHLSTVPDMRRGSVLMRAALEAAVVLVYMQALRNIPLGLATAILQATPLMITALAALGGRERVGPARWLAVLLGFAGVLMIVQPDSQGISPAMALAVLTAAIVTCRDLSNRLVPRKVPVLLIVFAASLANTVAGGVLGIAAGDVWFAPSGLDWLLMSSAAVTVLAASSLMTIAFRGTEVSAVSPFRYAGVPFALLIGFLVWGDLPNILASVGIFCVIGAGLFAMRDEARRTRSR